MIDEADEREEDSLTGRGLDNSRFPNASGVKIDVGAFFCGFFLDVEV